MQVLQQGCAPSSFCAAKFCEKGLEMKRSSMIQIVAEITSSRNLFHYQDQAELMRGTRGSAAELRHCPTMSC